MKEAHFPHYCDLETTIDTSDDCDDDTELDDDTGGTEVTTSVTGSSGFTQVKSHVVNAVT